MRPLRLVLGVLICAYALFTAWGCTTVVILRLSGTPPIMPDAEHLGSFLPVLLTITPLVFLLWPTACTLYFISGTRLLRGRRALPVFLAALAFDLGFLVSIKLAGAVHANPGAVDFDYVTATLTITVALLLWIAERGRGRSGGAARSAV